jgi:RHS repeat-associated protein
VGAADRPGQRRTPGGHLCHGRRRPERSRPLSPPTGNPASYGWETESNRLTCANTDGTTCSTSSPTSTTTVYTYDGNGLRTSASIGSSNTNFTWGSINGNPNLLSDGTWDFIYANGGDTPIEQIATTGSSPTSDLLLSDESGNVRGLVQLSSGTHQDQLVNYTDYDSYGNPITESGGSAETGGLTTPQTGISSSYVGSTPWGFGEGYMDPTGLIYLVNRYYDPVTAQFMSIDPELGVTGEPYQYADDDPVSLMDPSGLSTRRYWMTAGMAYEIGHDLTITGTIAALIAEIPELNAIASLAAEVLGDIARNLGHGLLVCNYRVSAASPRSQYTPQPCGMWLYVYFIFPYAIGSYIRHKITGSAISPPSIQLSCFAWVPETHCA